ncbi:MAG: hypothetical protein A2W23_08880 [Planctomycetes bacterium RBG_16_43_13]|nr:MAG: hypothetical protein A2W23_08880 [Planctomycetes bacterium RBG_16_43_13]
MKSISTLSLVSRLLKYGWKYKLLIAVAIAIMTVLAAIDRGRTILIKPILDEIPKTGDLEKLKDYALIALGLSIPLFIFKYAKEYLTSYLIQHIIVDIRNKVCEQIVNLPMRFFHSRRYGDIISRTTNDVNTMQPAFSFFFDDAIFQPLLMVAAIGLMFYVNWKLGLIVTLLYPIYLIPTVMLAKKLRKARRKSLEKLGDVTETMMQIYSGIRIVKAFNMENDEVDEYKTRNKSFLKKLMAAMRKKALSESLVELFIGLAAGVLMFISGWLIVKGEISAGGIVLFALALGMIYASVRTITVSYNKMQDAAAGCERVFELLDMHTTYSQEDGTVELSHIKGGVEYRNVSFAYDTQPVLQNVNLKAVPGEVIAIVGRSGAGKSTLLDLLCRFYDVVDGEILLDGIETRQLKRSSLLANIAIVSQEVFLFNTTIAENIRYGRRDATKDEIIAAAKTANIHDFIMTLEKGYDAIVGERGAKLSGGQRQKISIARAVLRNPSILILDEATSQLDTESEKQVQAALNNLMGLDTLTNSRKGRITFVIAHRLSTVINADRIIVLENGRIVETGRHADLLEHGGVYAGLYKTQVIT